MAYEKTPFIKLKDGIKAPSGFHYMPNGKLMSDADHIAVHGYVEQEIRSFNTDTRDILNEGETRLFTIRGDEQAVFSLEIYDNTGKYYNFNSKTWGTDKVKLSKKRLGGTYTVDVVFAALPDSSLKTYTVNLFAETVHNIKTTHAPFVDFRNADNSINVNKTTGSSSNILTRTIYQDALKTLRMSCVAPSLYEASGSGVDGATSSSNRIVIDADATDPNIVQVGDKVVTTGIASAVHALVTGVNPDGDNVNEIEISVSDSATNDAAISFTPPFNGMTPHDDDSDTGSWPISVSSGSSISAPFSVTITALSGRTFNVLRTPTTNDLCAYTTVTFESAALAIEGEDTSSASLFYRWPITNIANLKQGMVLDPTRTGTGVNTTTPASISNYRTTTTQKIIGEGNYDNYIKSVTVDDVLVDAVDAYANDVTTVDRNGKITAQKGNIVFNEQQADALKSNAVRMFAYGQAGIEALTGVKVKLNVTSMAYAGSTNPVRVATSTRTSSAVSASTTIPLAEVGNISQGMAIRGVGIDPSAANPTVVSKSAISGAGNVIASVAQTLEDGRALFFDGGAGSMTIRGSIEISNMAINDIDLFFDVERFLGAI